MTKCCKSILFCFRVQELQALLDSSSSSSSDSDTSSSSLDTHQRKRKRRKEEHTKDSKKGDKHDRHKKKHKGDRSKKDDRDKHNRNRRDKSGEYDWVEKSDHRKDRDRLHRSDREESYSEVKKIHKEYSNHTKRERCENEKQGVDSKNELEKDRRLGENVKRKHKKHKKEKHKRKHKKWIQFDIGLDRQQFWE